MGLKSEQLKILRQTAVEMDLGGSTDAEIAAVVERDASTVRRWLSNTRGRKVSIRSRVKEALTVDAMPNASTIAEKTGTTIGYVRNIQSDMRTKKRVRRTPEAMAAELLRSSPSLPPAISDSVGKAVVRRCLELANNDSQSEETKAHIDQAVRIFRGLRRIREEEPAKQKVNCLLLQLFATRAAIFRQQPAEVGRDQLRWGEKVALRILSRAYRLYGCECLFCKADISRREAWSQLHLGYLGQAEMFQAAFESIERSKSIYQETGSSGHDFRKNGEGSCALVESWIYLYRGLPGGKAGERDIRTGMKIANATILRSKGGLQDRLIYAFAFGLSKDSPEARIVALEKVNALLEKLHHSASTGRVKLEWLKGDLESGRGADDNAAKHFANALDYARELRSVEGVLASVSAYGSVSTPKLFLATLADLEEFRKVSRPLKSASWQKELPPWLAPSQSILIAAKKRVKCGDSASACALLWNEGRGDSFMPRPLCLA